jgi:hypothetical protein
MSIMAKSDLAKVVASVVADQAGLNKVDGQKLNARNGAKAPVRSLGLNSNLQGSKLKKGIREETPTKLKRNRADEHVREEPLDGVPSGGVYGLDDQRIGAEDSDEEEEEAHVEDVRPKKQTHSIWGGYRRNQQRRV